MKRQFPYLQDSKHNFYYIQWAHYSRGLPSKWCDLEDADWRKKAWHHEINWESEGGKQARTAYEALVSKLLIEDRVEPPAH